METRYLNKDQIPTIDNISRILNTIQLKGYKTKEWLKTNPILQPREIGIEFLEDGEKRIKIGDGKTHWKDLDYLDISNEKYNKILKKINSKVSLCKFNRIEKSRDQEINYINNSIDDLYIRSTSNREKIKEEINYANKLEKKFKITEIVHFILDIIIVSLIFILT